MHYIYIDEAGRGPLAGPVYVGIVIEEVAKKRILRASTTKFPVRKGSLYKKCDDSKILTEAKRDSIYEELTQNSQFHGTTGRVSAKDIDRHGIVWALRQGVLRAMHAFFVGGKYSATGLQARIVSQQYEVCLIIDGPHDFGLRKALSIEVVPVIDGDALIPMVGAASILAKVERDTYMKRIAKKYSKYEFEKHKGYGTKAHYAAIKRYGVSPEHRETYIH